MKMFKSWEKNAAITAVFMLSTTFAEQSLGIIGGQDTPFTGPPYAALVSSSGVLTPIDPGISNGFIDSVAINALNQGIIGGRNNTNGFAYAAVVSPSGIATPLALGIPNGIIYGVAINALSQGIIGGQDFTGTAPAYAAFVSPSAIATPIALGIPNGFINSVAINDFSQGLIGGGDNSGSFPAYAAFVSPSAIATPIALGLPNGIINSVAINSTSQGIIGGVDNSGSTPAYAALVSPSGIATPIALGLPSGIINSVAINGLGQGIIGGSDTSGIGSAYAALVSPSGIATPIALGLSSGIIKSVAINSSGQGIIGGEDNAPSGPAYAALVSPSGIATPIALGLPSGIINSVAINDFGQGLIGGQDSPVGGPAYAAIVSPSGIATPINLGLTSGAINSVALLPLLTHIPTGSLSGNNLSFANYINKNAPQDAFYFVPALFDGSLSQALESAAPTRNAISLYTASNNLFYLTTGLSNHIRNRSRYLRTSTQTYMTAVETSDWQAEELLASVCLQKPKRTCETPVRDPCDNEKTNSVWFEAIGAFAYQKPQHQTPGFHPSSGGAILAYDGKTSEHTRMGIGASYLYTHIDEKKKAGHSNINQEDLFVYGSWENKQFYLDACVLGGLFQTEQVRKIHMTGFEFKSKSKPHGWQLLPHAELGYHYTRPEGVELTFNPFVMVDWANAWQHSYHEKGSGPFNAGQKSHHSSLLRTEVSLRLYETVFFDCWDLVFQEKAGYVNVHSFGTGRVNAFLIGSPGSFTVTTLTAAQNLGVAEFAMIFAPHESGLTGTVFYQGEFGSKYQSHQVALELAWNF